MALVLQCFGVAACINIRFVVCWPLDPLRGLNFVPCAKVCESYSVSFSCSQPSIDQIYVLH